MLFEVAPSAVEVIYEFEYIQTSSRFIFWKYFLHKISTKTSYHVMKKTPYADRQTFINRVSEHEDTNVSNPTRTRLKDFHEPVTEPMPVNFTLYLTRNRNERDMIPEYNVVIKKKKNSISEKYALCILILIPRIFVIKINMHMHILIQMYFVDGNHI